MGASTRCAKLSFVGLMWRLFLIECLFVSDTWQGLELTMNIKKRTRCYNEIGLCAQNATTIIYSMGVAIGKRPIWLFKGKENFHFDL